MRITNLYLILTLMAGLCSCQTEAPTENINQNNVLTVNASLPDSDHTRAHITYGNTDHTQEIFQWDEEDEIFIYNLTQYKEYPDAAYFTTKSPNGCRASFFYQYDEVAGYTAPAVINQGDTLLVVFGQTERLKITNNAPETRNIVRIGVGTQDNKPQYILSNPYDDDAMKYMNGNLKMYDIVTATEDNKIPEVHFKHLSAILRITMRNETGHDIYPTLLEFEYPGTESFFNTSLYCNADAKAEGLNVYEDKEIFNGSDVYSDKVGTTINGKIGTADAGGYIKVGQTYDLYISTVPRIGNKIEGKEGLIINFVEEHLTGDKDKYSINIQDFKVPIEAGKRYWFNLTAVEEQDGTRKLMLTSDWLEQQKDQNANEGDQTTP